MESSARWARVQGGLCKGPAVAAWPGPRRARQRAVPSGGPVPIPTRLSRGWSCAGLVPDCSGSFRASPDGSAPAQQPQTVGTGPAQPGPGPGDAGLAPRGGGSMFQKRQSPPFLHPRHVSETVSACCLGGDSCHSVAGSGSGTQVPGCQGDAPPGSALHGHSSHPMAATMAPREPRSSGHLRSLGGRPCGPSDCVCCMAGTKAAAPQWEGTGRPDGDAAFHPHDGLLSQARQRTRSSSPDASRPAMQLTAWWPSSEGRDGTGTHGRAQTREPRPRGENTGL